MSPAVISNSSFSRLDLCIDKFIEIKRISGIEGEEIKEDFEKLKKNHNAIISCLFQFSIMLKFLRVPKKLFS